MRLFKLFVFIFLFSLVIPPAAAFESNAIVKFDVPYDTYYRSGFDDLVFDFSLLTVKPDVLKAIALKNLGDADNLHHIKYMVLWADNGPTGFQGMGVDQELGYFDYVSFGPSWYMDNLNIKIDGNRRFFVTIETFALIDKNATVKMQLPKLVDHDNDASFDPGDLGVFMDSGNNGPTDTVITNENTQVISQSEFDFIGPKLAITNLADGQVINSSDFTVTGLARDPGGHGLRSFAIQIDEQKLTIDNYDTQTYQWVYDWTGITDGQHTVQIQAYDSSGNYTATEVLTVTVMPQAVDLANSEVDVDKYLVSNVGLDIVNGTVILKDAAEQPVADRRVNIIVPQDCVLVMSRQLTDNQGRLEFDFYSPKLGLKNIKVMVDDQVLAELTITVVEEDLDDAGITYGDLIKAGTEAVYYYGADGKRYVFPTLSVFNSWYNDFSQVKKITDEQLAMIPIGGNVTFKPGVYMVKINTDPKVYAVDQGGQLRWVSSEDMARNIYGDNWAKKIMDVADVFFFDYAIVDPVTHSEDFQPSKLIDEVSSINIDKNLL